MAYLCEAFDEATKVCQQWTEYTPIIPELTNEQIGQVWAWFIVAMLISWAFKKLIHLFGVW